MEVRTYEAHNLQELAAWITTVHQILRTRPDGYVKPILTIVNSDQQPVYKLIVTERA